MFEFYNHVKEITLIFQNGRLIFANESALHFFNCYFHTIEEKPLAFFFPNGLPEGKTELALRGGGSLTCECKRLVQGGEEILLVQQTSDSVQEGEIRLTTSKAMYDPLMIGKTAIMTQSITEPLQNIMEAAEHLLKEADIQLKMREELQDISKNAGIVYHKTKRMLEEYETLSLNQEPSVCCFDLKDAVEKACRRIEEYLILERLPVKLRFSSRTSSCLILADKQQIVKAVTGLIAGSVRYLTDHEEKGRINVKAYAEENAGKVVIEDNAKETDSLFEKLAYADMFSLSMPSDREVLSLQMIHSMVEKNNGTIYLAKNKGIGMRYTIQFPLTDKNRFFEKEKEVDYKAIIFHEMEYYLSV